MFNLGHGNSPHTLLTMPVVRIQTSGAGLIRAIRLVAGDSVLLDVVAHVLLGTSPSGSMKDPQQLLDASATRINPMTEPPADTDTDEQDHTVPDGVESKITAMIETINRSYDSLPAGQSYVHAFIHPFILTFTTPSPSDPSKTDFETAYHDLCQQQYFTGKLAKMYPFGRWQKCRKIRHPADLMKVRTDKQAWSCRLCHPHHWHVDMIKTETHDDQKTKRKKWHFGNCRKHFLSKIHCERVVSTTATTSTIVDATTQLHTEHVYAEASAHTQCRTYITHQASNCHIPHHNHMSTGARRHHPERCHRANVQAQHATHVHGTLTRLYRAGSTCGCRAKTYSCVGNNGSTKAGVRRNGLQIDQAECSHRHSQAW